MRAFYSSKRRIFYFWSKN